jgi:flagellar basal body rod protein FlgB
VGKNICLKNSKSFKPKNTDFYKNMAKKTKKRQNKENEKKVKIISTRPLGKPLHGKFLAMIIKNHIMIAANFFTLCW